MSAVTKRIWLWPLLLLAVCVVSAHAQDGVNPEDKAILQRTGKIIANPAQYADPAQAKRAEAMAKRAKQGQDPMALEQAREIARKVFQRRASNMPPEQARQMHKPVHGRVYRLFVSQSMPKAELVAAFEASRQRKDLTIVFRGTKPGQGVQTFLGKLQAMWKIHAALDAAPPAVTIDPPAFRKYTIKAVPTLVAIEDGKELGKVAGEPSPAWLARQLDEGRSGDLGRRGSVYPIAEDSLIKRMKERAAKIDWDKLKRDAMADFWKQFTFVDLPEATKQRKRYMDPTVVATKTITTPSGKVVVRKGQRVNPLKVIGFHQILFIFDATDPKQVTMAKHQKSQNGKPVKFITTRVPRATGWQSLAKLEAKLGRQVTLLSEPVRKRFDVRDVPTRVTAEGDHFAIQSLVPGDSTQQSIKE